MCALTIAMFALTPSFLLNYAGDNLLRTRGALSQSLPIFIIVIVDSIFVFQVAMARRQRWTFRLQVKLPFAHLLTTRDKLKYFCGSNFTKYCENNNQSQIVVSCLEDGSLGNNQLCEPGKTLTITSVYDCRNAILHVREHFLQFLFYE